MPGCDALGDGITVPKTSVGYDVIAIRNCMAKLKQSSDAFADQTDVMIDASPDLPYRVVIDFLSVIGATTDGKVLFPEFYFDHVLAPDLNLQPGPSAREDLRPPRVDPHDPRRVRVQTMQ